jgi:hypothetical protein
MMPEEDLSPYPSQAESDAMMLRAVAARPNLLTRVMLAAEGEDLTPVMTQAQNDAAMLIAAGPAPDTLPPILKDTPYVGGSATVGGTLNCTMGNWTGQPTSYAYQWKRDGTTDLGTSADYVVVAADAGHGLTCVVTATNANGSTEASPSNAVGIDGATGMAMASEPPAARVPRR